MIIDQLPLLGGDAQATDEIPIERGTTTYKTTPDKFLAAMQTDATPTSGSTKPVQSGGVYSSIQTVNNSIVRPNLLDNAYFVGGGSQSGDGVFPINQRGNTSYEAGGGYCIDRWNRTGSNIAVQLNSGYIRITKSSASGNPGIVQVLSNKDIVGKKVTVSVLYKTNSTAVRLLAGTSNMSLPSSTSITLASLTAASFALESFGNYTNERLIALQLRSGFATSDYLDVYAFKVEIGDTQTLAHEESGAWVVNEIPDFGAELAKCQRYYIKFGLDPRFRASSIFTNSIQFFLPTPVSMSTGATLSIIGAPSVETINGAAQSDFTFELLSTQYDALHINGVMISANKSAHGLTDATLRAAGMALSAEA